MSGDPVIDLASIGSDASGYAEAFRNLIGAAASASTPVILMQTGRCGYMYGTNADIVAATKTIKGGTLQPGAFIKFTGLAVKYAPNSGGGNFRVRVSQGANTVIIANASTAATMNTQDFDYELFLSSDLKWAYAKGSTTINFYNNPAPSVDVVYSPSTSLSGVGANTSPRLQSNAAAFATYSSPPTTETKLIDWSQDVKLEVITKMATTDRIELLGFVAMMYQPSGYLANPKYAIIPGDSVSEGTGSTPTGTTPNDWVAVLGRTRLGTPLRTLGLGGQKSTDITDRALADADCKYARLIVFMGLNDVNGLGTAAATIKANIERIIAYRGGGSVGKQNLIICNLYPSTAWTVGSALRNDFLAVNAMIDSDYSDLKCDLFAKMTTGSSNPGFPDPSKLSDAIHPNNSGHADIASAVDATMTSRGMT